MTVPVSPSLSGRRAHVAVVALTLGVFAAVVGFVTLQLRAGLREQILLREAETLSAVASLQLANEAAALAEVGLADAPGELLAAVLKASRLRGVLAIRVFDAQRKFAGSVPVAMSDEEPAAADWNERPFARLHRRDKLASLAGLEAEGEREGLAIPLLEAWVPLRRKDGAELAGVAQFWIDGHSLAAEFARLDTRLWWQAALAWLTGAVVMVLALMWAFQRLATVNRSLADRTEDLQRANRELVLAAKTSALGAVTAHLIHEIKNPLAGLESFVAGQSEAGGKGENGHELAAATELTRRLRTMINDVVGVLRDEQHGAHFELSADEVIEIAVTRARATANAAGVRLVAESSGVTRLEGRRANLAGLVLRNLIQNAAEASPPAGVVTVKGGATPEGGVQFLVEDGGRGLPEAVRARLFQPCSSTKEGGSGLGLALSQQLAQQAGGRIELVRSDVDGTVFRLAFGPAS